MLFMAYSGFASRTLIYLADSFFFHKTVKKYTTTRSPYIFAGFNSQYWTETSRSIASQDQLTKFMTPLLAASQKTTSTCLPSYENDPETGLVILEPSSRAVNACPRTVPLVFVESFDVIVKVAETVP